MKRWLGRLGAALCGAGLALGAYGQTGSAALTWTPPTQNTNGTPLTDLVGYKVYWGTTLGAYSSVAQVNNAAATAYTVSALAPGAWFFAVTSLSTSGGESNFSNAATKTIAGGGPVNCVVDNPAWILGTPTPAVCPANGMQSRVDSRTLSIITPPSGGGLACPPLNETRTVPLTCTPPIGAPPSPTMAPSASSITSAIIVAPTWTPKGFDFRATSNFAVDPPGSTYVVGEVYPTTRNGVTFGWESASIPPAVNRQSANPALAGLAYVFNWLPESVFRVDLPAPGRYRVRLAAGDWQYAQAAFWEVRDGTAVLIAPPQVGVPAGSFADAAGAVLSAAAWPASNAPIDLVFTTTTLRFAVKPPTGGGGSVLTNLSISVAP